MQELDFHYCKIQFSPLGQVKIYVLSIKQFFKLAIIPNIKTLWLNLGIDLARSKD
jgi:hypothetical protein